MADFISMFVQIMWTLLYISFIMMSGWFIMKGFRGYLTWYIRLLGRLATGFIALVCAIGLAPFMPFGSNSSIFKLLFDAINLVVAGAVSTLVIMVSLFLISDKIYNISGMEKSMEKLKLKIEKAKSFEMEMTGKPKLSRILRPINLIGIAILIVFLALTLSNFRGFPDPVKNVQDFVSSMLTEQGASPELIRTLCDFMDNYNQSGNFSEDCAGPIEIAQSFNASLDDIPAIISQLPIYVDSSIKSVIESGSGESVELMYRVEYRQKTYALALTRGQSICTATGNKFCGCMRPL